MKQFLCCDKGYNVVDVHHRSDWINIEQPDRDDMIYLVEKLKVPASFLEALSDPDERPRVDREAGWQLVVIRVPKPGVKDNAPYRTVPLGVLTSDDYTVTVCCFDVPELQDFIAYSQRRELDIKRQADFILHILFNATTWFLAYLKKMSRRVAVAEHELMDSVKNNDLLSLMRLQQSLVFFNTSLKGNQVLVERLQRIYGDDIDDDLCDDLEVEMKQADNTVSVYTEILESIMDACGSIISNNVNQVMKRMTGISIILMVPTLVASFYGMNVDGLLWANLPASFYIVIVIAAVLTVVSFFLLRKVKWF